MSTAKKAPKKVTYVMKSKGGCKGAVTGQTYTYVPDDEIEAPEGEFKHLGGGDYEVKKAGRKKKAAEDDGGEENTE